jgi:hypothetical protein
LRRIVKVLAIVLGVYVVIVVAFESLVVFMGKRQAEHGVAPGEHWLVITTTDAGGTHDTVVGGVMVDGQLYVAANHWPRGWFDRALANPSIAVTRDGVRASYRAEPVSGAEHDRVAAKYTIPIPIRILTGFPPRSFLRLSPQT